MYKFVLDPSKENSIPENFKLVETEVDFLRHDGSDNPSLWIRGEALCHWVTDVYRVRGWREGEDYRVVASPRLRLQRLLGERAETISHTLVGRIIEQLDIHGGLQLNDLLSRLTQNDFWSQPPSRAHAARWLLINFGAEFAPLVETQRERWAQECAEECVKAAYSIPLNQRHDYLRSWLIADESNALGVFPLEIEDARAAQLLKDEWGKSLRATHGAAIEALSPLHPNIALIAQAAFDYFIQHSDNLTELIVRRVAPYLPMPQRARLEEALPQPPPSPLALDDAVESVLRWAVDEYLPYRQWQVRSGDQVAERHASKASDEFANWMLHNYSRLTMSSRDTSHLNVRVKYAVDNLLHQSPVLWVVVDGLNYTNHQRLLHLLGETEAGLGVEEDHILFATIPTITEKAKFTLTTGLFTNENNSSRRNIKDVFVSLYNDGVYAGTSRMDHLHAALGKNDFRICYWNMLEIDDCYHQQTDPIAASRNVEARLSALALNVSDLIMKSPHSDRLAVCICTDHGQMIGSCIKPDSLRAGVQVHGRTAYGDLLDGDVFTDEAYRKNPDETMVVVNSTRFRLDSPMTIALKDLYFGGWSEDLQHRAWGVHGGLHPEEIVVGFSVLKRNPARLPVTASVSGTGETRKPGKLFIKIDNPNRAPIISMILTSAAIEECKNGLALSGGVRAVSEESFEVETIAFPSPAEGDSLTVEGMLRYEFGDGILHECKVFGELTSKQMYSTQRPSLLDKFKR